MNGEFYSITFRPKKKRRMSWQQRAVESFKFGARETLCVATQRKGEGTQALALFYREALKRYKKRIKVLCATEAATQRFFEKELPEQGVPYDFFALLANETLPVDEAELILFDGVDGVSAERVASVAAIVHKTRAALVTTAREYNEETTGDTADATAPLQRLSRRVFRADDAK